MSNSPKFKVTNKRESRIKKRSASYLESKVKTNLNLIYLREISAKSSN
jgi:hypothetical protein